jgi:hypothetical protein
VPPYTGNITNVNGGNYFVQISNNGLTIKLTVPSPTRIVSSLMRNTRLAEIAFMPLKIGRKTVVFFQQGQGISHIGK